MSLICICTTRTSVGVASGAAEAGEGVGKVDRAQ
jgi:hypothetical protein